METKRTVNREGNSDGLLRDLMKININIFILIHERVSCNTSPLRSSPRSGLTGISQPGEGKGREMVRQPPTGWRASGLDQVLGPCFSLREGLLKSKSSCHSHEVFPVSEGYGTHTVDTWGYSPLFFSTW